MTNEVKQSIITRFRDRFTETVSIGGDGTRIIKQYPLEIEFFILEIAEESEKRGISLVTEGSYVCPRHTTTLRCLDCIGENIKVMEEEG